jgi:hypothetical protein
MPTTIPTPSLSFSPVPLAPSANDGASATPLPAPSPTANDVRPVARPDFAAYGRLLADPRVRSYLWARLDDVNIARADKRELVDGVVATLWKRRTAKYSVDNLGRMLGLARTILDGRLVDYWRHQAVLDAKVVNPPQPDGGHSRKPQNQPTFVEELQPPTSMTPERSLLAKERLEYVNSVAAQIGLTDDDVEVMYAVTWDPTASYEELAAERRTTASALRSRIHRLQEKVRKGWSRHTKRSLVLMLLLLAMLLLFALSALGPARNPPPPAPLPEPTVHEIAPVAPAATSPADRPHEVKPGAAPNP